ncbi:MAG: DNA gyrase subunit A, partial [Leucobacter sp.]|nr:DNA gyrase subunit A [Leucobacter sp.]
RSQARGGKGVRGATLRGDDVVEHFLTVSTHHWLLFFTNTGRVYRAKTYEVPEGGRDAKGQHLANLLALAPDETVTQVLDLRDFVEDRYLVLATRDGLVKKTPLTDYDTNRTGGIIAIKLREGDELVQAFITEADDDVLLISRQGMSVRFTATDQALRPMGRSTSGVRGMNFRDGDSLLAASTIGRAGHGAVAPGDGGEGAAGASEDATDFVFIVTEGGYAKRTAVDEYRVQQRGGYGIKVAKLDENRGDLVGGFIVNEADEVLCVLASGKVVRSDVSEVPAKGRNTMGVVFARFPEGDRIIGIARNTERGLDGDDSEDGAEDPAEQGETGPTETPNETGTAPAESKEDVNE